MTIGTISVIIGVVLLVLLSLFSKDDEGVDQNEGHNGLDQGGLTDVDASDDPGLAHLPGNSYHYSWSASHSDNE